MNFKYRGSLLTAVREASGPTLIDVEARESDSDIFIGFSLPDGYAGVNLSTDEAKRLRKLLKKAIKSNKEGK